MRTVLADFESSLKRIRSLSDRIIQETGAALTNPDVLALHETQQCGAVVLLTGYLEGFLKGLVKEFIGSLSQSGTAFTALPPDVQRLHFEGGGKFLREASIAGREGRPTHFGTVTREDVAMRIHSATTGSSFDLVWEAFADTEANPGPKVVKRIGGSLGLQPATFWRDVSSACGDAAWSATAIEASLKTLVDKRNACAHTGRVTPVPTAAEILKYVEMLGALATGMVVTLEGHLRFLSPSPPPAGTPPHPPSGAPP
jgi:RiboL-PSP-HEPN